MCLGTGNPGRCPGLLYFSPSGFGRTDSNVQALEEWVEDFALGWRTVVAIEDENEDDQAQVSLLTSAATLGESGVARDGCGEQVSH